MKSIGKTSPNAVKRYKAKAITRITLDVPREIGERFKAKCKAEGVPLAQILKQAIDQYINK